MDYDWDKEIQDVLIAEIDMIERNYKEYEFDQKIGEFIIIKMKED